MAESVLRKISYPGRRLLLLCAGFMTMAFGIAFSIRAALGTSPISSLPYVTALISGLSVGVTTIIVNSVFIVMQVLILRRRFQKFQLLQLPGVVLFGLMIDAANFAVAGLGLSGYFSQWIFCLVGVLLLAAGISFEVSADLIMTPGEGLVLAICQVVPIRFGNMKVIFDVSLVCTSIVLSFACLGRLEGVREGTVAAALLVGQVVKPLSRLMKKVEPMIFGN